MYFWAVPTIFNFSDETARLSLRRQIKFKLKVKGRIGEVLHVIRHSLDTGIPVSNRVQTNKVGSIGKRCLVFSTTSYTEARLLGDRVKQRVAPRLPTCPVRSQPSTKKQRERSIHTFQPLSDICYGENIFDHFWWVFTFCFHLISDHFHSR